MEIGYGLTIWTARAAVALYVCGLILLLQRRWMAARFVSTAGLLIYLVHVCCAFQYFYDWSHDIAYRETARQTAQLFGIDWGGGIYLNYLFTGAWLADCTFAWWSLRRWETRPRWISTALHGFLVFMVVNATVVVWILRAVRKPLLERPL